MNKPGVKAFVVFDKKVLLILRDNNPEIPFPNTWSLLGGGIDMDETADEAIKRELKEEICVIPETITYLGKHVYRDGSLVFKYLVYLTEKEQENIKLGNEGQELNFFSIGQISELNIDFKMYFTKHKEHIKQVIEDKCIPQLDLLGLSY